MRKLFSIFAALTLSAGLWAQSPGTFAQLQQLVNDASVGSTITLTNDYTYEGTETVTDGGVSITKSLTIDLNNHTISGNGKSRCIKLSGGSQASPISVTIKNGTITNGYTQFCGGAITVGRVSQSDYVTATIDNCKFSDNKTEQTPEKYNGFGAGVFVAQGSKCVVTNTEFTGNTASHYGGALCNYGEDCIVTGCTFSQNKVTAGSDAVGGAIYNIANKSCTITGGTFSENTASGAGGAIANYGTASIDGASFTNNEAVNGGGAILNRWYACTVKNATFTENKATNGVGGAIFNRATGGTCKIEGTTSFTGNTATTNGGAIYNEGTNCTVSGGTFSGNTATGTNGIGGAIYNAANYTITITGNASFSQNTAANAGGAVANYGTGSIDGASFSKNTAPSGGAILNRTQTCTVKNATFTENKATADNGVGGAIWNNGGTCNIEGTTSFTGNTATSLGGAIYNLNTCTVTGGTFSQNSANCGGAIQNDGTLNLTPAEGKSIEIKNNHATTAEGGVANWGTINMSGKVIVEDNFLADGTTPSNFAPWNATPVNIVGAMTGSDIYFELVDENDAFTYGTLTSGYSTNSGSTIANAFFHYDGPDTWFANMKDGEIVLDPAGTFAHLQFLIDNTPDGGTLTLTMNHTYEGTDVYNYSDGGVNINKSLTIDLNGHTINGNGKNRCFLLSGGTQASPIQVTIKNGTITNGYTQYDGGAISVGTIADARYVNATIENCTISNNVSAETVEGHNGYGGGIYIRTYSNCTINNTTFTNNTAEAGGAIENYGTCAINTATFSKNSAKYGGAVDITSGTCTITEAEFTENSAPEGQGGAIYVGKGTTCTINSATFTENSAKYGGAIENHETCAINTATFSKNSAECGGAVDITNGTCTITDAEFTENSAPEGQGGAIYVGKGTICTINSASITKNTAGWGGAIINWGALNLTAASDNSIVIENNHATEAKGGIAANEATTNISGKVIIKDNHEGTDNTPSNFAKRDGSVNITGNMTGSNIYFKLYDSEDYFTYGTLTSGYSTKSGSTDLNAFFHYDGPATIGSHNIGVALKEGEIFVGGIYTRDVTNGNWGTICLPWESVALEGGDFYNVLGTKDAELGVALTPIEAPNQLVAGKPYVFKATSNQIKVYYDPETEVEEEVYAENHIYGSFEGCDVPAGQYIIYNNLLYKSSGSNVIDEYRAYFDVEGMDPFVQSQAPARVVFFGGRQAPTSLGGEADRLRDRKVIKVIENGQFRIVRDGKTYNAQGIEL